LITHAVAQPQDKVPPAPGGTAPPTIVLPAGAPLPGVTPKSLGLPETVSPMIGFYQGVDQKAKTVKLAFVESVAETSVKTVKKNGVDEQVLEAAYKPTAISGGVAFADIQFYNVQGQKLTIDSVVAKLKVGDTVLITGDEKPLGAAYLKVIKPDTIIAIFPLDPFVEPFFGPPPDAPVAPAPVPIGPPEPPRPAPRPAPK
jgi:hypothetical protein